MKRQLLLFAMMVSVALFGLFGAVAFSQSYSSSIFSPNSTVLNSAYEVINCKTTFASMQVKDIIQNVPSLAYLNSDLTNVTNANAQLQIYANGGNYTVFRNYIFNNYNIALKLLVLSATSGLKSANVSKNTSAILKNDFNASKKVYLNCTNVSGASYAQYKIKWYTTILNDYQNGLNAFGSTTRINITNLTLILQGAQTEVVIPLQNGVANSTSVSQLQSVIQKYCLFSGCANGFNYHLAAQFTIEKLNLIIAKIKTTKIAANYSSQIDQAQTTLNSASSELKTVGTAPYTGDENTIIWSNINSTVITIKSILSSARTRVQR